MPITREQIVDRVATLRRGVEELKINIAATEGAIQEYGRLLEQLDAESTANVDAPSAPRLVKD